MIGGFRQHLDGGFAATGLIDGDTNAPVGQTGAADLTGTAVYTGIGGPVTGACPRYFYTVDGQAGLTAVVGSLHPSLYFNIWANLQAGGADDFGSFIFEGQSGGSRGPKQWYMLLAPMASPTVYGALFNLRSLLYSGAAGKWNLLTLDFVEYRVSYRRWGEGAVPAGTQIVGVGILQSVTNPAPLPDFSNADAFGSWNYADYRLTDGAIPNRRRC